jgi:hypothetical protein
MVMYSECEAVLLLTLCVLIENVRVRISSMHIPSLARAVEVNAEAGLQLLSIVARSAHVLRTHETKALDHGGSLIEALNMAKVHKHWQTEAICK